MKSKSVQLIITSPPYNIGKEYEEKIEINNYLDRHSEIIRECKRLLKPGGSICWQTGTYIRENGEESKSIIPLDVLFYQVFTDFGFKLRNRIVWVFGHGLHSTYRLSGRHEIICWYTIDDEYLFNLEAVRVKQKYRGKRAYHGANKGKPSGNPRGKNPSDFWRDIDFEDHEKELIEQITDLWEHIPNVKGNHLEKVKHPCQYPVALVRRLVRMLSNKNHLVLDPYAGTGTTLIGGWLEGRRVAGAEIEKNYIEIAQDRLKQLFRGELRFREEKPVFQPNGHEKVVREPDEWLK